MSMKECKKKNQKANKMIPQTSKKCKGTGQAKGFGCGTLTLYRKFGLCSTCQYEWATTNDAGKVWFSKQMIRI